MKFIDHFSDIDFESVTKDILYNYIEPNQKTKRHRLNIFLTLLDYISIFDLLKLRALCTRFYLDDNIDEPKTKILGKTNFGNILKYIIRLGGLR